MSVLDVETIYSDLFALASQVQGADWSNVPIPLQRFTRNYIPIEQVPPGQTPWLQQLELPEERTRKGRGLSSRKLHALIDIVFQRQDAYPDTQPFSLILNNFQKSMDALFEMSEPQTFCMNNFHGNITDIYFTKISRNEGILVKPAFIRFWIEILTAV
jgi:hypothetical protein